MNKCVCGGRVKLKLVIPEEKGAMPYWQAVCTQCHTTLPLKSIGRIEAEIEWNNYAMEMYLLNEKYHDVNKTMEEWNSLRTKKGA